MTSTEPKLMRKLLNETGLGSFPGDKRIRLLEAIDKHGSISQAAKAVPFSYKDAGEAVDQMNSLAPEPTVLRSAGGRHGGGTELTAFGRRLVPITGRWNGNIRVRWTSLAAVSMKAVFSMWRDSARC